ncbi:PH domain-containing protein [Streptosporangium sp. NPDC000396]|uniref:PH domain-containing protein n=1 Tax=Streptosporangium sp. NPDC000396 TaxID=3366185 RepID=UPI0036B2EB83
MGDRVQAGAHEHGETGAEWMRLDRRMLWLNLGWLAGPLTPIAITALVARDRLNLATVITFGSVLVTFAVITTIGLLKYATTRYRVTGERVELHSGLIFRRHRSIPRDRVRSVDLTASPIHRVLGLAKIKIGTGQNDAEKGFALDGISGADALLLKQGLLDRTDSADSAIAELRPAWIRYALLSSWSLLIGFTPFGMFFRALDMFGIEPSEVGFLGDLWTVITGTNPVVVVVVALGVVLAIGLSGTLALYVECWWNFRLTREPDGTFLVRRGLLTTRSLSLEERRLRGVEVAEPLPLRWGRGARVNAVATGLGEDDSTALLPPAPRAEAHRIAAVVLAEDVSPTLDTLRTHPRSALRRRITRAIWSPLVLAALFAGLAAWLSWVPGLLWLVGLALLPVGLLMARDAYRNLGHGLHGRYLVTRCGTARRRTVALDRTAIIGWTVSRSPFQRRSDLLTLAATTAAGKGAYKIRDVSVTQGLAFAEETVPGLLAPFLH